LICTHIGIYIASILQIHKAVNLSSTHIYSCTGDQYMILKLTARREFAISSDKSISAKLNKARWGKKLKWLEAWVATKLDHLRFYFLHNFHLGQNKHITLVSMNCLKTFVSLNETSFNCSLAGAEEIKSMKLQACACHLIYTVITRC